MTYISKTLIFWIKMWCQGLLAVL